jgi:hypothetical protein
MPKTTKTKSATTKTTHANRFASYPDAELPSLTALWQKPATRRAAQKEIDRRAAAAHETRTGFDALLLKIAQEHLGRDIETLEKRRVGSLDFHECAAWGIRAALEAAYEAGRSDAKAGR